MSAISTWCQVIQCDLTEEQGEIITHNAGDVSITIVTMAPGDSVLPWFIVLIEIKIISADFN